MRNAGALILGLMLGAVAAPAVGQTSPDSGPAEMVLTLDETIRLALQNSRALVGARLSRAEQKFSLDIAEDRYRPQASISASANAANHGDETAEASFGPTLRVPTGGNFSLSLDKPLAGERDRSSAYRLSFSQPLLRGFGPDIDTAPLRKARMQERINASSYRNRIAGVVISVIGAYRSVVRAQRAITISRGSLERAARQLEINRALIRAGRLAAREIVQSEAEVANRELSLIETENSLQSARSSLINILDIDTPTRIRLEEALDVEPLRPDLEESIETAFARRTDHLQAVLGVDRARIDLGVARNARLWDLRLNAGMSGRSDEAQIDYRAGLNLTIPLTDRSPDLGLLRAQNDLRRAEMALQESRQAIRIEVRQAVHDVEVGLRKIELARKSRELAEQKLDIEQKKLAQGLTSTFRLTQVEDDLVRAQNGELDSILSYLNALTSLDRTLGTTLDRWGVDVERSGQ